jgi:hypothetical protein
MSEFKFSSPNCGQHIQGDERWSGRQINCPACQQPLVVPSLGAPVIETPTAAGPRMTQKPSGKKVKYYRFEDVPWYRRSTLNHIFAIMGLCIPLLVWWVVAMCLTGDIYKNKRNPDGSLKTWGTFSKVFSVLLVIMQLGAIGLFMAGSAVGVARGPAASRGQSFMCENNLKQIGLAFKVWAIDHDNQFPFNVSTTAGGSKEGCFRGNDGFDQNAAIHFKVIYKELSDPKILACPADAAKRPATDFTSLEAMNVSYLLRSGTNISDATPDEILAMCPMGWCCPILLPGKRSRAFCLRRMATSWPKSTKTRAELVRFNWP